MPIFTMAIAIPVMASLLVGGFECQKTAYKGWNSLTLGDRVCQTLMFLAYMVPLSIDLIGIGFHGMDYFSIFAGPSRIGFIILVLHLPGLCSGCDLLANLYEFLDGKCGYNVIYDFVYNTIGIVTSLYLSFVFLFFVCLTSIQMFCFCLLTFVSK